MKIAGKLFRTGIVLSVTIAVLCGCATIFEGGTQPVTFKSVPDSAQLTIRNRAGEKVHVGATPATVTLKRGAGYFKSEAYQVTVEKAGYAPTTVSLTAGVNGWYVANLIFGGLIGLLVVDPMTGAMYDLSHDTVETSLKSTGLESSNDNGTLTVMLMEDVPPALRTHLREINTPIALQR